MAIEPRGIPEVPRRRPPSSRWNGSTSAKGKFNDRRWTFFDGSMMEGLGIDVPLCFTLGIFHLQQIYRYGWFEKCETNPQKGTSIPTPGQ